MLRRYDLVHPTAAGWASLRGQLATPGAPAPAAAVLACDHDLLTHWARHRLPLIVAQPRPGVPPGCCSVGLPAPARWGRRRLALVLAPQAVQAVDTLPALADVAAAWPWGPLARALDAALRAAGAAARVHGSHGWQWITGLACTRPGSDLDLLVDVPTLEAAVVAAGLLDAATLPCRLDGELRLPEGSTVAWRELQALVQGRTARVLLKRPQGPVLVTPEGLRAAVDAAALVAELPR